LAFEIRDPIAGRYLSTDTVAATTPAGYLGCFGGNDEFRLHRPLLAPRLPTRAQRRIRARLD
jgi:hypothetical protein